MGKSIKKRNWAFIVYPTKEELDRLGSKYDGLDGYGSAPLNWKELLDRTGLEYAISPLHDKDLLEDNSQRTKKPHYHVIVCYGNTTTFNNVVNLTKQFNSPIPQALEQVRGYFRYLTHKDNADKFQYDDRDIVVGNGFNIANYTELTKMEINHIKQQLQLLIRNEEIIEYSELMDFLLDNEMMLEYEIASSNTYFFDKYITSKRNMRKRKKIIDEETGEIKEY